jgi:hypothetical protein
VTLPLEYRVYAGGAGSSSQVSETGSGRTLSISSGEVLFESDRPLREGMDADLYLAWPASLSESVGLTLRIRGRVARADTSVTTLTITHYEFHVRSKPPASEHEAPETDSLLSESAGA